MNNQVYGILARFETPEKLLLAAQEVRKSGFKKFDANYIRKYY